LEVPGQLGDFLNYLVKRRRRLVVRVLCWDFPVIYGLKRELPMTFALGTGIGMAPGLIGMTVFGSQMGNALGRDGDINGWLIGGAIALIAAASLLARRLAARGQQQGHPPRGQPNNPPLRRSDSKPPLPAPSSRALRRVEST
jgi:hypothetical protein